jgi:uncharacterized protein (TIGR03492 family)
VPTLTLLSNGHGEDVVGAQLARELQRRRPDLHLQAFPVVGEGSAYGSDGVTLLGPRRTLPSGGFAFHAVEYLWRDLRAGLLTLTLAQLRALRRFETDVLLVVGDLYAQALSAFVRTRARFVVQPLVSAWLSRGLDSRRPHRLVMENITYPERALMRHLAQQIYVRDAPTERLLRGYGLRHVQALGNPMLDALHGRPIASLADEPFVVALLPGTRLHTPAALAIMLEALTRLDGVAGTVAWAGAELPPLPTWERIEVGEEPGLIATIRRGGAVVRLYEGRFADVVASAHAVLGTAGTANEQAASLGLPVVSFALPPFYSEAYTRNQKRLLGDALTLVPPDPDAIAARIDGLRRDPAGREAARRAGRERMGAPGGTAAIVADLLERAGRLGLL